MICPVCKCVFCWDFADVETANGHRKVYCSESCRKRASPSARRKQNQRGRLVSCRERNKRRYESYGHASRAAKLIWVDSGDTLRPYKCPCGSWHLTSKPPDARTLPARNDR